jgi:RNA polymerase sigma factor (sigma-70 family)
LQVVSEEVYADWEAIYRDNVDRIYRLMFVKVGNRFDAEDLTAEVFLAALGPLQVSASVGEVRAYLLVTARTVLARFWRRTLGRPITTIEDDYPDPAGVEAPGSDAPARAEAVLAGLPVQYRRILQLRFLEALSVKQAAAELGVSVANAKVLQHRALRRAAQLGEEGEQR